MSERCPYCSAEFKVFEVGTSFSGACREPINCPYCKRFIREERTSGVFQEELINAPESALARYLNLTDSEWEEMAAELNADDGNSGDMIYSYWFTVPEGTSDEILTKNGWTVNQIVRGIPVWVVENDTHDVDEG